MVSIFLDCFSIRQEQNGGAWCPKEVISRAVREFLEVKLHSEHLVTHLETQGRFGNGQGREFTEAYQVEYWRDTLGRWVLYKDARSKKVRNILQISLKTKMTYYFAKCENNLCKILKFKMKIQVF
jgi:F5/8 type C domain